MTKINFSLIKNFRDIELVNLTDNSTKQKITFIVKGTLLGKSQRGNLIIKIQNKKYLEMFDTITKQVKNFIENDPNIDLSEKETKIDLYSENDNENIIYPKCDIEEIGCERSDTVKVQLVVNALCIGDKYINLNTKVHKILKTGVDETLKVDEVIDLF